MLTPEAAAVLACLTTEGDASLWASAWVGGDLPLLTRRRDGAVLRAAAWKARLCAWRHRDPTEALEALEAAGLAPPGSDGRTWWWPACPAGPACAGRGEVIAPRRTCPTMLEMVPCRACGGGPGRARHPPDIASIASVAALGPTRWAVAEELARVVERDAEVTWRAMTAEDVRRHRQCAADAGGGAEVGALARVFARTAAHASAAAFVLQVVPLPPAWDAMWRPPDAGAVEWRAMRDLYYLGVQLVAHAAGSVTLAVEALR